VRDARSLLTVGDRTYEIFRLEALDGPGIDVARLPYSLRILLENLLRHEDDVVVTRADVEALARWDPAAAAAREIAFTPARVLLQDFTGVPAVVDLAAMRDAMAALGGDPKKINPLQPAELVIDHSMQVDVWASADALERNKEFDYGRNRERYAFLRWGQSAFQNFKVVPPYTGICHQVNLEYLARVVFTSEENPNGRQGASGHPLAYPDTLVGTDSHTPMVNGLGVLGWGVGGIEAEAAMLGQPVAMLIPQVVGVRLEGELPEGATATDLVLTVAELLRKQGVVGKFVEFFGPGIASLPVADRATIGNMSPEYGATCAIFPVDDETLRYLRFTGRPEWRVQLVEAYMKEQGLFHTTGSPEPRFTTSLALDLATVEPSIAGPRRPQDRIPLSHAKSAFAQALPSLLPTGSAPAGKPAAASASGGVSAAALEHGAIVISSITSCTNTSNPAVMVAAGLLARKAVERGLRSQPWVKTSLAPGSRVVTDYLDRAGLTPYLDQLGFNLVGYGCATCIGNSGPLPPEISEAIDRGGLVVCSVLSGNRNFEGRIHPEVRANYLMSPPLAVAYALAGRIDLDLYNEPLGQDTQGRSVFLKDVWPDRHEIRQVIEAAVQSEMFASEYGHVYEGDDVWRGLPTPSGDRYAWDPASTYVKHPPYFEGMKDQAPEVVPEIHGARVLAFLGDSVTTDHISPAGSIKLKSPAGQYLVEQGVQPGDFNSYGSRRGNHEVMVRGTFANVRIRNQLAPGTEGGFTTHMPSGEVMTIYDAAVRYQADGTPLLVLAGKEYGSGSSRDWAAKGPYLQGVKAVLAESFERIHRSNLVGMGILPLEFLEGQNAKALGLTGRETIDIEGISGMIATGFARGREVRVRATRADGSDVDFRALARIDTPQEALYYRHGGILQYVIRQLLGGKEKALAISRSVASGAQRIHPPRPSMVDESSQESFPASDAPAY
jgi:aconitate hydratase